MSEHSSLKPERLGLPLLDTVPGYKKVAQLIEREIVEGRLPAGELLPTEGDLATQLGVNRSTVREGIRALENAGLIRRVGAKRLMVSVPDSNALAWVNVRAMGLQKVTFQELWEMQMELEPFCADLAAARITPAVADALRANLLATEAQLQDDAAVIRLDIEFHQLIAQAARNAALLLSLQPIGILLFSATVDLYQKVPPARHRLLYAHQQIAEAVISHDQQTARAWMSKHIRDFRRGYLVAGISLESPIELDARALQR